MRGLGLGLGVGAVTGYPPTHSMGGGGVGVAPLDRPFTYIYPRGLYTLPALSGVEVGVVRYQQAAGATEEETGAGNNKSKYVNTPSYTSLTPAN